jgi:CRP/FNR family cyclic AMP-dependent transcriptional regulator
VTEDIAKLLRETEIFRPLDAAAAASLARKAIEKKLARNEILFVAGESAAGLFVITSGSVRAFRTAIDGREQVIHIEKAVTTIAELPVFDGGAYPSTVAAEEPSTVLFLPREKVLAVFMEHPSAALAAAKLFAGRLRKCAELVESLSLREVGQRVAGLLLNEAKRADSLMFELPLTQVQMAARIGTVREVVSRVLTKLQQNNLIEVKGRRVAILDKEALAAYAEGD